MNFLLLLLALGQFTGDRSTRDKWEGVPWRQIEQWKMFDELANSEIFYRLELTGMKPPGLEGETSLTKEEMDKARPGMPFKRHSGTLWAQYFRFTTQGWKSHVLRFHSIPQRKKQYTFGGGKSRQTGYWEECRAWTKRVKNYWGRYYPGETPPSLSCTFGDLPKRQRAKKEVVPYEPSEPPKGTITDELKAPPVGPVIDKGSRTTYGASDGLPVNQSQVNLGFHRATGSATLSSGQVVVTINIAVDGAKNDLSFQGVNSYSGSAWSTDTTNSNSYTVYPLSRTQILIKSSNGADAATVNYRVMGD